MSIPTSVTSIGSWAFAYSTGLTSVSIPASVTAISDFVFWDCTSLLVINVDAANPAYASIDGVLYDKPASRLIQCPAGKAGSASIPASVTAIGFGAFSFCRSLTSVSIPASVTSIGGWAFKDCSSLAEIMVPASVVLIGENAFAHCTLLSSVSVDAANPVYTTQDGVLYDKALSTLIQWPKGKIGVASIPVSVTTIGNYAFFDCIGVTSITLPIGVTSIGSAAFWNCNDLRSMYFFASPPALAQDSFSYKTTPVVYRLHSAAGWSSTFGGMPVEIFQSVDVPAGQTTMVSVAAEATRFLKQGAGTAILNTASTHTFGTVVEAGELIVQLRNALGSGILEVQANASVRLEAGCGPVLVTKLDIANAARLDLGTSRLHIPPNGFSESDIRSQLIAGRDGGTWSGTSGITSTFAGGDRAIGYRVAEGSGNIPSGFMEVAYAAPGDSNLDGVIDILDIGDILAAGKFDTGRTANWVQGDTNYDGVLDILDISQILGTNLFNQGTYLTQGSTRSTAVGPGGLATFDSALVFAALAMDSSGPTTTKRKSF
jgi:autotransporter-associated beta strand protein